MPTFRIKGASFGISSACASSSHALGQAIDLIRLGRQQRVFVVGAEDCDKFAILPFAAVRALSTQTDPAKSPCAFDKKRDGFVGTGGAVTLVVEELEHARARGVTDDQIYGELLGWGQASDGYNVLAPVPDGNGLARAMISAMSEAGVEPAQVEYINAHATSTPFGDGSEINAIKTAFPDPAHRPLVSSTKSLTGHGLSLAGVMEAGFCGLTLKEGFVPVSREHHGAGPGVRRGAGHHGTRGPRAGDRHQQLQRLRRHERGRGDAPVDAGGVGSGSAMTAKRVFLTGASAGIGLAVARSLCAAGCEVWGTARQVARLPADLANFHPVALDLNDPASWREAFSVAQRAAGRALRRVDQQRGRRLVRARARKSRRNEFAGRSSRRWRWDRSN